MAIAPGSRLGPYEILAEIGAGGMGEVYRARDTRLARSVAIKVLPKATAAEANFRERFEREARAASALNHPNIISVFDVGCEASINYLVTELVDGVTLRQRREKRQLTPREVISLGAQIADGLSAAHAAGIVHRDLKPDNVMVTREGLIKILDFGLAKPLHDAAAAEQTRVEISQAGVLIGTIGYMAPEQVRGHLVDARSDLFSLGVVLYEMASGQRAFSRPSTVETLNAILNEDVPELPDTVPAGLRQIIAHCLEKDPVCRFQSAQDVAFALRVFDGHTGPEGRAEKLPAARSGSRRALLYGALGLASAALVALGWLAAHLTEQPIGREGTIQLELHAPTNSVLPDVPQLAISPDGGSLVFIATVETIPYLWLRRLDSAQVEKIPGSAGAAFPFWSHDGQLIAFFSGGQLKTVHPVNGAVETICRAANGRGGSWGMNGEILFASADQGLSFVRAVPGGEVRAVTQLGRETQDTGHLHPTMLPDGEHFLFVVRSRRQEQTGVFIGSTRGGTPYRLLDVDSQVAYVSGYLIYGREIGAQNLRLQSPWRTALVTRAALLAQRFDLGKLAVLGDPQKLVDEVRYSGQMSASAFSISANGVLAYQPPDRPPNTELRWLDRSGATLSVVQENTFYPHPHLSRDGSQLALSLLDAEHGTPDVWAIDLASGRRTRMTFDPGVDFDAVWSPNGRQLAFASDRSGTHEIYVADLDSPTRARQLTTLGGYNYPTDWSPDGRYVLYQGTSGRSTAVFAAPVSGGESVMIADGPFGESAGAVSPSGKWLASTSRSAPERRDVFVQSFPKGSRRFQVSSVGGTDPRWSQGGQEIFFLSDDATKLYSAKIGGGENWRVENPSLVMNLQLWKGPPTPVIYYDVSAAGDRFVVDVMVSPPTRSPFTVVVGSIDSLTRR